MKLKKQGFTLLELLIVIAILSILATAVVLVLNPGRILYDTKRAATSTKLQELVNVINRIKGLSGKSLYQITGGWWSMQPCSSTTTPAWNNIQCQTAIASSMLLIEAEGIRLGVSGSLDSFNMDGWGSPFMIDENEGISGSCLRDIIYSAGANGVTFTSTSDDDVYPHERGAYAWDSSSLPIFNVTVACQGIAG